MRWSSWDSGYGYPLRQLSIGEVSPKNVRRHLILGSFGKIPCILLRNTCVAKLEWIIQVSPAYIFGWVILGLIWITVVYFMIHDVTVGSGVSCWVLIRWCWFQLDIWVFYQSQGECRGGDRSVVAIFVSYLQLHKMALSEHLAISW